MGACDNLTTEAMTYEGSRCGRGRPPEQRPAKHVGRAGSGTAAHSTASNGASRVSGHHQRSGGVESRNAAMDRGQWHAGPVQSHRTGCFASAMHDWQAAVARGPLHQQRLGQPAEPGRISKECVILGSDAGSVFKWCTKSRVRHQPARVRIGQAGSQSRPSHQRPLIRSSAASTSASSRTRSWRLISSAFRQAHMSLSRAQLSPSAPQQHGFSSLAVGAEFSPAGAVRPAGGFFFPVLDMFVSFVDMPSIFIFLPDFETATDGNPTWHQLHQTK